MKKSLIALAVAGTFAAPAAFAATANVDVYGRVNISVEDSNAQNKDLQVTDRQTYIGFKGSEDLGGGMKAVFQIEQAISTAPAGNDGVGGGPSIANRNTYVGVAGGFGTVLMGRHDTPYKLATTKLDPFGDTIADYNGDTNNTGIGMNGVDLVHITHDHRSPSAIAYISPTVAGFHIAAAVVATNAAANLNDGNRTYDATSLAAVYENGPIFASLSRQNVDSVNSVGTKAGVGYNLGDAKIGFVYEDVDYRTPTDRKSWLVNAVYGMGPMAAKVEYGRISKQGTQNDANKLALGADYNMSKRTTAYLVWDRDYDQSKTTPGTKKSTTGYSIGVKHSF